jgi:multiple sugar transport system ATP-binding protein
VAKLLQIDHLLDRKPGQLSGGQRQRVAMGRALVRNPDVFLFDEPLSNLDAKLRVDMRTEIKKLHQKLKTTIVYVTHDQIEAMTLSTRIAVMNKGYVQQLGTPKEIYDTPSNVFVATFMGSPAMNIVPSTRSSSKRPCRMPPSPMPTARPPPAVQPAEPRGMGGQAHPARHPPRGDHRPRRRRPQVGQHPVALTNRVGVTEPAGSDTFVTMTLSGKDIARMRADASVAAGQVFDFAVNMDKAVAFDPATEDRITP